MCKILIHNVLTAFVNNFSADLRDFLNIFKVREKNGVIYQNLAFIGLLCLWLIYYHSNHLLIPVKDLCVVGISADILITLLFFNLYKNKFSLVWAFIHNLTLGLIVAFLFVWTNDSFSVKPITTEVLPVENVYMQDNHQRHNRDLEPVLTVNIKGKPHKITYDKSATKSALNARQVSVTLKEGFWGYWVLADIELITKE